MTDLNDLKQQLYRKIEQDQQPELTPNRMELLKYSAVRANQPTEDWKELRANQNLEQLKESPIQGARINFGQSLPKVENKQHLSIISSSQRSIRA